jgi:hypothetical protein
MKGDDFLDLWLSESHEFTSSRWKAPSTTIEITDFVSLGLIVRSDSLFHQGEIGTFVQVDVNVEKHWMRASRSWIKLFHLLSFWMWKIILSEWQKILAIQWICKRPGCSVRRNAAYEINQFILGVANWPITFPLSCLGQWVRTVHVMPLISDKSKKSLMNLLIS